MRSARQAHRGVREVRLSDGNLDIGMPRQGDLRELVLVGGHRVFRDRQWAHRHSGARVFGQTNLLPQIRHRVEVLLFGHLQALPHGLVLDFRQDQIRGCGLGGFCLATNRRTNWALNSASCRAIRSFSRR